MFSRILVRNYLSLVYVLLKYLKHIWIKPSFQTHWVMIEPLQMNQKDTFRKAWFKVICFSVGCVAVVHGVCHVDVFIRLMRCMLTQVEQLHKIIWKCLILLLLLLQLLAAPKTIVTLEPASPTFLADPGVDQVDESKGNEISCSLRPISKQKTKKHGGKKTHCKHSLSLYNIILYVMFGKSRRYCTQNPDIFVDQVVIDRPESLMSYVHCAMSHW